MNPLSGTPVIQYLHDKESFLTGIQTVVPYRITPELRKTLDTYRQAAETREQDWENLRQELDAIEIKAEGDSYKSFKLWVRLPDTKQALAIALTDKHQLSNDPRLKYYVAARRPIDTDDDSAWWLLHTDKGWSRVRSEEHYAPSKALYERAFRIHFAQNWQYQFWRDYENKVTDDIEKLRHPERADLHYFMPGHEYPFWESQSYGHDAARPQKYIDDKTGLIFVPRYLTWELDTVKSQGNLQQGKERVSVHLQLAGAEPVSYAEAFTILNEAGKHQDIYPIEGLASESWSEFNPIPAHGTLVPRYQYFELGPDRREIFLQVSAAFGARKDRHEEMLKKYGVEKFSYDKGYKKFSAYFEEGRGTWRPGWEPDSPKEAGKSYWWKIDLDNESLDPELVSYLREYYFNDPMRKYFDDVQNEICEIGAIAANNMYDTENAAETLLQTFKRDYKRYPHVLISDDAVLLVYPSLLLIEQDSGVLERLHSITPEIFKGKPEINLNRLAIFIKNARALTYAQAGAILEAGNHLPSAEAMRAAEPGSLIILNKPDQNGGPS